MARRRSGRPVSGVLVLDKPKGISSNGALQRVKRLYRAAKAGHTGSLDPLATGVLPLCFGEATKFSQYLLDADKVYESRFRLGERSTTGDAEGEIVERKSAARVDASAVEAAMAAFRGPISQLPPMYSAVKQGGQPLYKLARAGREVPREPRQVVIHHFALQGIRPGECCEIDVRVSCSKGTYIRSLAEDLGAALGVGGHVAELRRCAVGPFSLESAVSMESLEALAAEEALPSMDALLRPVDEVLAHLPRLRLPESSGFYIRQGQPVLVPNAPCDGMVRLALETGEFLGLGEILDDGRVAPRRLIVTGR